MMDPQRSANLLVTYRDALLDDVLPFWLKHAIDPEHGGYFTALDRDGTVFDTDKSVWFQGRFAWLLSELSVRESARRESWLEAAGSGIEFLRNHCFGDDGRMYFQVTADGRPLRQRRYVFSELFAVIAYAAWAHATEDSRAADDASLLLRSTLQLLRTPGALPPRTNQQTRPTHGFGVPMILLNTAHIVRKCLGDYLDSRTLCDDIIEDSLQEIRGRFLNDEHRAVLECAGPNGELIDHADGRTLNPGHAIEGAWFVLNEARHRNGDRELIELGTTMLDWMWEWGWDKEYGGILYFRDVLDYPVQEYWHDMKFWWPQCEAIIATLMAWSMTGEQRYADWHRLIHDWTWERFPDPEFGEWYGYLHRDGRLSSRAKGTLWKGPFHIPRMLWICWNLLAETSEPET